MLNVEIVDQWPTLDRTHPDLRLIEDYVAWRKTPPFHDGGRSAWCRSTSELRLEHGHVVRSFKIKGVGTPDAEGTPRPPSPRSSFARLRAHFGFTDAGEFIWVTTQRQQPIGGLTLDRARAELDVSRALVRFGCPSEIPLLLFRYTDPDLLFCQEGHEPQSLCVLVTGLPCTHHHRAKPILPLTRGEAAADANLIGIHDAWRSALRSDTRLDVFAAFVRLQARTLRKFHQAGFFRFSMTLDNVDYDHLKNECHFVDLDSCLPLAKCNDVTRPLQIMRDVVSGLFHITLVLFRRENIGPIASNKGVAVRYFQAFLSEYFAEIKTIPSVVFTVTEAAFESWYRLAALPPEVDNSGVQGLLPDAGGTRRADVPQNWGWIFEPDMYCTFVAIVWGLYQRSEWARVYPNPLGANHLYEQVASFGSRARAHELEDALGDHV